MYTVGELPIDNRLETVDYDLALETALRRMFDTGYTQIDATREGDLIGVLTYRSVVRSLLTLGRPDVARDLDTVSVGAAVEDTHYQRGRDGPRPVRRVRRGKPTSPSNGRGGGGSSPTTICSRG